MQYYIFSLEENKEDAFELCKTLDIKQLYKQAKQYLIEKKENDRVKELNKIHEQRIKEEQERLELEKVEQDKIKQEL